MTTKNTAWTAEEDAALARAIADNVSPARLSVRLNRSVGSIKRRQRELGLRGERRGPRKATASIDPVAQVARWLQACRSGDIFSLMALYSADATLECACTCSAVYAGLEAIGEYWLPKLESTAPDRFSPIDVRVEGEVVVVDYLSFEAKPVAMYLWFDSSGKISRSECGPRDFTKLAA